MACLTSLLTFFFFSFRAREEHSLFLVQYFHDAFQGLLLREIVTFSMGMIIVHTRGDI